jgi:dUTPase
MSDNESDIASDSNTCAWMCSPFAIRSREDAAWQELSAHLKTTKLVSLIEEIENMAKHDQYQYEDFGDAEDALVRRAFFEGDGYTWWNHDHSTEYNREYRNMSYDMVRDDIKHLKILRFLVFSVKTQEGLWGYLCGPFMYYRYGTDKWGRFTKLVGPGRYRNLMSYEESGRPLLKKRHGAAGFVLTAKLSVTFPTLVVQPMETLGVPTGLKVAPPPGYHLEIRALEQNIGEFTVEPLPIDRDYRGEITVHISNNKKHWQEDLVIVHQLEVAQLVCIKSYDQAGVHRVTELPPKPFTVSEAYTDSITTQLWLKDQENARVMAPYMTPFPYTAEDQDIRAELHRRQEELGLPLSLICKENMPDPEVNWNERRTREHSEGSPQGLPSEGFYEYDTVSEEQYILQALLKAPRQNPTRRSVWRRRITRAEIRQHMLALQEEVLEEAAVEDQLRRLQEAEQ